MSNEFCENDVRISRSKAKKKKKELLLALFLFSFLSAFSTHEASTCYFNATLYINLILIYR